MKAVMKTMIVLSLIMFLFGSLEGCKKKSVEEEIKQLTKKMNEAKTVEETVEIANRIEKLKEKLKKNTKEVSVKLGQPFTFWQYDYDLTEPKRETQFRITFDKPLIDKFHPYEPKFMEIFKGQKTPIPGTPASEGKKYFGVSVKIENLGPRKSALKQKIELKVDKGFIYQLSGYMIDNPEKDSPRMNQFDTLEQGETGWIRLSCEIPIETKPIEVFGIFGRQYNEAPIVTNFRLKLTQSGGDTGEIERKSTSQDRKFQESIAGEYTKIEGAEKMPGTYIFKKDGTTAFSQPGSDVKLLTMRWNIENGIIQLYDAGKKFEGKIENNTIIVESKRGQIRFVKQSDKDTIPDSTSQLPPLATPGLEEKEKLGQQINTKLKTYSNKDSFPLPPISIALRTTAPELVEKVETIYFTALDYQFYSLRSLRFARDFLNEGEVAKSKKYIEKAERYYNFATSLQRDSFSVLDSAYSAAQWMVVYKASRTALGFTSTGLGIGASTLFDLGTLYTDYSLDTSTTSIEEAKKNLIAKAIPNVLLRFTGVSDIVGNAVKQGWGSSQAFPVLQKIMGSSEFKDAVLKEFMRLGGDVGDYAAKKAIEDALERILRGSMEVGVEKAEPSAPRRSVRKSRNAEVGGEKAEPSAPPSSVRSEPVYTAPD